MNIRNGRTTYRSIIFATPCILATGCASWFLNGAIMAERDYKPESKANFKAQNCITLPDNKPTESADVTYHLVQDGLFERSPDGSGALIQNKWSDADGDHYFTWVQSSGWEYVIPKDPAVPGKKLVYVGVDKAEGADGVTKPTSQPGAKCDFVPST